MDLTINNRDISHALVSLKHVARSGRKERINEGNK